MSQRGKTTNACRDKTEGEKDCEEEIRKWQKNETNRPTDRARNSKRKTKKYRK